MNTYLDRYQAESHIRELHREAQQRRLARDARPARRRPRRIAIDWKLPLPDLSWSGARGPRPA